MKCVLRFIFPYFYAIVSFSFFVCASCDSLQDIGPREGDLGLDHNSVYDSGRPGNVCVCSDYRHLYRSKSEPIHTRMFNEGFYGTEVVPSSGNLTNCGTWGPRAQRWQAGGSIAICDLGRELSLARLLTLCPRK